MNLPPKWIQTRVDRVASINARIGWKALTANEYQSEGFVFLSTPNIRSESIDFESVNYISEYRYDESPELKLQVGDVLLVKDGNTLGITNVIKELPRQATVNGSIAVLRPFDIEPRFLRYTLACTVTQGAINALKGGMGVPHLFQWDIKRLPISMPPLHEQRHIADFLDEEVGRLDTLVAARKAQSASLLELWHSRLAAAMNGQLLTYGSIPMRRIACSVEQGWSPQCDDVRAEPDEWAVLKTSAVSWGRFAPLEHKRLPRGVDPDLRHKVLDGDLLMTRGSGSPGHVGVAVEADTGGRRLLLSDLLYRVRLTPGWSRTFTVFALQSLPVRARIELLLRGQSGQTIKLRAEDVRAIELPNAPVSVQTELAVQLGAEKRSTSQIIGGIEASLALLLERRQALITAAVTGQIDVTTARGVAV